VEEHIVQPHRRAFDEDGALLRLDGTDKVKRRFKGLETLAALGLVAGDALAHFVVKALRRREVAGAFGARESVPLRLAGLSAFDSPDKECFHLFLHAIGAKP
jgi:hypothetical protein